MLHLRNFSLVRMRRDVVVVTTNCIFYRLFINHLYSYLLGYNILIYVDTNNLLKDRKHPVYSLYIITVEKRNRRSSDFRSFTVLRRT